MEQKSSMRDFARYTILSVLGTLGVSCYILADTFFVSKGVGTDGLAALNLAIPVYNFIHGTGLMLGMGGATKLSVCKSQGKQEEVNRFFTNTVYLAILFSGAFFLLGLFFSDQLAILLGADANVLEMTDTYLKWLLLFAPAFILNDVLLCFVRNDESPQLSMIAMLIGSFSNIVLDYIFIFPMQMGIFGAIFATGLSPIISIVMMLPHWTRKKNTFHFVKTKMEANIVKQDLTLGFPSLIAQLSSGIVMIVFNAIILKLEGNTGVAAYGVVANISLVIVAVFTGIAQGVQPLISTFYGGGNDKQARTVLRYAMTTMLTISCAVYLLIFVFARPITTVFNSENNTELQRIAVQGLKLYFLSVVFVGYNSILATFFTSIEKALPAHILSVLRGLILIIPIAFFLSALWEMTGVWLTYPITEFLVALLGFIMYQH
ncbi:MATE family efflux transporter [Bianquea renquensis]|uniref:Multidrug export protein MepA n=1 Tax=Bianquea renquensis TaxID=2763661 RepID=A0A926I270_9FIRM|nr:MATE family efflux transporter [Bianquea renquensis]MBC8544999.1 MATE family efflux transporter [Bianquea renquensis]